MKKPYVITAGMLALAAVYCFRGVELTAAAVPVFMGLLVMAAYMSVRRMRGACVMAYGAVSASFWLASPWIQPAMSTRVILAVLTCAAGYALHKSMSKPEMLAYRQKGMMALIALASLYASFASFGYRLFLAGSMMSFSLGRLLCLFLGAVWFCPVIVMLLSVLEYWGAKAENRTLAGGTSCGVVWAVSSLLALGCMTITFVGFFPGSFFADTIMQLLMAERGLYINWHPVVHTTVMHVIMSIFGHPSAIIYVQLMITAALIGKAAVIVYECGVQPGKIYIATVVFALLPNHNMANLNPMKDSMFTYALIWSIILLYHVTLNVSVVRRPGWMVQAVLCMYFMAELRHNGILPLFFVIVLLLVLTIRNWKVMGIRAVVCAALALSMIGVTNGPVFKALDVMPNAVSPYVTMFCGVASCINKGMQFSEETTEQLEKVMTLEEWAQNYGRFVGHDRYLMRTGVINRFSYAVYDSREAFDGYFDEMKTLLNLKDFSMSEAFSIYFEALGKYPDIVIKDRLDGMNIMWDVTQPDDEDSFNDRYYLLVQACEEIGLHVEGVSDGTVHLMSSPFIDFYHRLCTFAFGEEKTGDQVSDMLLWRTGAYLIFFAVLAIFWTKHRLYRMWWAATPMLGNIAAMMLVLYHQSFRYVYFIQLGVLLLTIMTFSMMHVRRVKTAEKRN